MALVGKAVNGSDTITFDLASAILICAKCDHSLVASRQLPYKSRRLSVKKADSGHAMAKETESTPFSIPQKPRLVAAILFCKPKSPSQSLAAGFKTGVFIIVKAAF